MNNKPEEPPFARHGRYYLLLKIAVVVLAALMLIHLLGQ